MKYKYEFPVHPMGDIPKREFRYVDSSGTTSVSQSHESFRLEERNSVGWIYVKAEKTPILEDGKWYLVRHKNICDQDAVIVKFHNMGRLSDSPKSATWIKANEYTLIAEMQEVAQ